MRKSSAVTRGNFRRLFSTASFWVILALSVLYMEYIFEPIRLYLQDSGSKIGLLDLMTYFMNDSTVSGFMVLCCMGLLFNAPSADDLQRYLLLRCGRKAWAWGQIRYCFRVCLFYMVFLVICVAAWSSPWLEWTGRWSHGILAFVDEFVYETYDSFLNFDVWIPRVYTPLSAFGIQFVLHVMVCFALGMLMANVNMIIDRRFGFAVVAVPIAFDLLLEEYFAQSVKYFSPLSLCRISGLDYGDEMGRPTIVFAIVALTVAGILFSLLMLFYVRRREIRL